MIRYWFKFDFTNYADIIPYGAYLGCGITAANYEQAMLLLKTKVFYDVELPNIIECIENVDIRTLDQGHVIPNMRAPIYFGIWYPLGYD